MAVKSIVEVEESVQGALEALPSILRSSPSTPVTRQIGEALSILAPAGYHPVVELQENGRRKRRTARADNWSPETGEILISFSKDSSSEQPQEREAEPPRAQFVGPRTREFHAIPERQRLREADSPAHRIAVSQSARPPAPLRHQESEAVSATPPDFREEELCHALDEVERQGRAFIALKRFRDDVLPSKGFSWTLDAEQRQGVLAAAIEKGLIVTSRIPNPRSPFPTTAIRLNRTRFAGGSETRRFSPVRIHGEPLSSTILRDRGTY
jgi:hypothetical protein